MLEAGMVRERECHCSMTNAPFLFTVTRIHVAQSFAVAFTLSCTCWQIQLCWGRTRDCISAKLSDDADAAVLQAKT